VDIYIQIFLTSAQVGGEWSASRPGHFTSGERAPGTHWIEGWLDLRTGLKDVEKGTFLSLPGLELQPLYRPARNPCSQKNLVKKDLEANSISPHVDAREWSFRQVIIVLGDVSYFVAGPMAIRE
jgi:hypothetical protein